MRSARAPTAVCAALLAVLACGTVASAAAARLPPAVVAMVSRSARGRTATLVSPPIRTHTSRSFLLAFVVAGAPGSHERVTHLHGDGLRWSRVARSAGAAGDTEIWKARARRRLAGAITARLASASASPASITILAYGGSSPRLRRHTSHQGRSSRPRIGLKPAAGSLVWTVGVSWGQRGPIRSSSLSPEDRVVIASFDRRRRSGSFLQLTVARSSHIPRVSDAGWSRAWGSASADVVIPGLTRAIEEGLITATGAHTARRAPSLAGLPPGCAPPPSFQVGVQDDPVFLGRQPAMSPSRGFELGGDVFHADLLRLNFVWGEVKQFGWAPYDRAVQMARERCWTVHLTIAPTPTYEESYLNSELSARNVNLGLLASFAREVAARYAGQVQRYAIDNEPNGNLFLNSGGSKAEDMRTYDQMYMAAREAIRGVDPGAEVIAGELSQRFLSSWLENVATLPSDGVAIHPYSLTEDLESFAHQVAPRPLLVSEDGVSASEPNQVGQDLERVEAARRAGVTEFVLYQLSRADATRPGRWNTGIE